MLDEEFEGKDLFSGGFGGCGWDGRFDAFGRVFWRVIGGPFQGDF